MAMGHVSPSVLPFHVSVSFHQCSILPSSSNILSTGETGKIWGSSYNKKLFRKLGNVKKEKYFRFSFVVLQIRARRQDGRTAWMINWASAAGWRGTTLLPWTDTHITYVYERYSATFPNPSQDKTSKWSKLNCNHDDKQNCNIYTAQNKEQNR